jgi:putative FmdB family regulatory protein
MPLYEYECKSCRERVEVIQKIDEAPYSICPKCGGDMKKLMSAPAIQFKGSGFYKTDYASSSSTPASSASSETKSESKPSGDSSAAASTKSDSSSSSSTT